MSSALFALRQGVRVGMMYVFLQTADVRLFNILLTTAGNLLNHGSSTL